MNNLLIKILPDIDTIVKGISKGFDDQNDLRQDLVLKIYSNKKKVKQLYKEKKLKGWLYVVARNLNTDRQKNSREILCSQIMLYDKGGYVTSDEHSQQTGFIDLLLHNNTPEDDGHYLPYIKPLPEMLKQLPEIERLWVETYINCNFNYSEIQRRTKIPGQKGIARRHAKERIQTIFEKWKQLDIYLPQ